MIQRTDIRLALPSKGRLQQETLDFLAACGLAVDLGHIRRYLAALPAIPGLTIIFQRPGDIVLSVRDGGVDMGITGYDALAERAGGDERILMLHDALGYGICRLALAVPEEWTEVRSVADLAQLARSWTMDGRRLRVATKYPRLAGDYLAEHEISGAELIAAEGALEVAPHIGYADMIADLVSTGTTLRDNRLRELEDGGILDSQACLIGNREALCQRPEVLAVAHQLIEFIEAHRRAEGYRLVFANIRGLSPEAIAERLFAQEGLSGLQGPTISRVYLRGNRDPNWYAVNIIVHNDNLHQAIQGLRAAGGSGVVVSPVTYIFEEEPARYRALLERLALC